MTDDFIFVMWSICSCRNYANEILWIFLFYGCMILLYSLDIHFVLLWDILQLSHHLTSTPPMRTLSAHAIIIVRFDIGVSRKVVVLEFWRYNALWFYYLEMLCTMLHHFFLLLVLFLPLVPFLFFLSGWCYPDEISASSWKVSCSCCR